VLFWDEVCENIFAGDDHMNYVLICYVEKEEMRKVSNDVIVRR
jgi:hypothetical protein